MSIRNAVMLAVSMVLAGCAATEQLKGQLTEMSGQLTQSLSQITQLKPQQALKLTPEQQKAKKALEEVLVCDRKMAFKEVAALFKTLGATAGKAEEDSDGWEESWTNYPFTFKSPSPVSLGGYEVTEVIVRHGGYGNYTTDYSSYLAVAWQDFYKRHGIKTDQNLPSWKPKLKETERLHDTRIHIGRTEKVIVLGCGFTEPDSQEAHEAQQP